MTQTVTYYGGPLDGTGESLPDDLANQVGLFKQTVSSGTRYTYGATNLTATPRPMAVLHTATETALRAYPLPTWYDVTQAELTPIAGTVGQSYPTLGWVTKFNETHPCVKPGLVGDIIITAPQVTFLLTGAPPNATALHIIGAQATSATGCLFVVPIKTSVAIVGANGTAERYHAYMPNLYFVSQWFVPGLAVPWSNPVTARTWT